MNNLCESIIKWSSAIAQATAVTSMLLRSFKSWKKYTFKDLLILLQIYMYFCKYQLGGRVYIFFISTELTVY